MKIFLSQTWAVLCKKYWLFKQNRIRILFKRCLEFSTFSTFYCLKVLNRVYLIVNKNTFLPSEIPVQRSNFQTLSGHCNFNNSGILLALLLIHLKASPSCAHSKITHLQNLSSSSKWCVAEFLVIYNPGLKSGLSFYRIVLSMFVQ